MEKSPLREGWYLIHQRFEDVWKRYGYFSKKGHHVSEMPAEQRNLLKAYDKLAGDVVRLEEELAHTRGQIVRQAALQRWASNESDPPTELSA